ncbi:glutamine-rich protein 2 [Centropristis striata]|uniref:glutamine-rich protein 2 n=1 Tax=Centropristis striata TaxID=184440 RepID=UPI0027E13F23|nr:glutamine-rich protein 2 [Centropristis striata]
MSEQNISLFDLLNLAIETPHKGAVNFSALHALLHAVLRQLGIREMKTRWRDTPPGEEYQDALEGITALEQDQHPEEDPLRAQRDISVAEQEVQPGTELQERVAPTSRPASGGQWRFESRIQTCEDGVSKALMLIQELHSQKDDLKVELKKLHNQQEMVGDEAETVSDMEQCCHRVFALEETVRSLRETLQKYPDPEELSQFVSWDVMQSTLLSERENLQQELVNSGVVDPATYTPFNNNSTAANTAPSHVSTPSSPHPVDDTEGSAGHISADTRTATDAASVLSEPQQQADPNTGLMAAGVPLTRKPSGSLRYSETVQALKDIGKLKERFNKLEARAAALEEGKVDQSQLTHLKELIPNKGSRDVSKDLMEQLKQQRALIDSLMSDREKLDSLEDMFMNLTSQDREMEMSSVAASGSEKSDSRASQELRQQLSYLRKCVQKLEEDVRQLKVKQASSEERTTDRQLQDQLDDLRGMLEDMMQSLTFELCEAGQDEGEDSQGLGQSKERSAFSIGTVNVGRKLGLLFQHYEQLQDRVSSLLQQQTGDRARPLKDTENVELVNDVQKSILQLQTDCEKLHETSRCLHEDNRQKQSHIEELYKTTEELDEKKADKHMVESEIKADKSALDSKVSRRQFDSATEQLNAMFHELLNKVTGQEQDWHQVIDRLSTEMECKLNRIELDSVKKQLEDRWKNIHEKLQAQGAPEHEDAAGIRKQLVDRFHCLSCDRPVFMHTPGQPSVKLPSTPGFPSHKSIRPFTVYALEQFRQHYRSLKPGTNRHTFEAASSSRRREQLQESHTAISRQVESTRRTRHSFNRTGHNLIHYQTRGLHERVSEMADHSYLGMSRSCGGSHTVTSASQRRSGLQHMKHHIQTEGDSGLIQSEEVDIVGMDGHIYKGRLNASARNAETKLPTISSKDAAGMCKTKDKAKTSLPHRPAASPEAGHGAAAHQPHSAKSAQCSRSASSVSGRDWPVSALGCTSHSSVTQITEPAADQLDL